MTTLAPSPLLLTVPPVSGIQYRCLWWESMADILVPFSGPVKETIEEAVCHADGLRQSRRISRVLIEARPASKMPWPRWWD